jgi:hypothetical protein
MNLNDLANLGQIVGAAAVVVSLIYVALQIRQNTNAVRSATAQTVHEHFASWYHLLAADAELSQVVVNGLRDYFSLSETEKVRFVATFMAFLAYSQNAFLKWREGLLASPLWLGWEFVIMNLVCAPGGKAFWMVSGDFVHTRMLAASSITARGSISASAIRRTTVRKHCESWSYRRNRVSIARMHAAVGIESRAATSGRATFRDQDAKILSRRSGSQLSLSPKRHKESS